MPKRCKVRRESIGLAVTGGMGFFDGLTAGIEEYKKSGKIGAAVKEGFAGARFWVDIWTC